MPSDLLKCLICPKKPKFSDVSHLLTHVGSKGHLAHLHSLQVRSHQELDATQQLTVYNQWFQEHEVATLLSERMQQKAQKQTNKAAANRRRIATDVAGNMKTFIHPNVSIPSAYSAERPAFEAEQAAAGLQETKFPIADLVSEYPVLALSPPAVSFDDFHDDSKLHIEARDEDEVKDVEKPSSGSPKLKGVHWPGMALFDAAPEDLRKKRNQRKDGSVLERLERNAAMVEPTETVSSASGNVLKHRHMDDLENDSPVEGEEALTHPTPKRKRVKVSQARRSIKTENNKRPRKPRQSRPRRTLPDTPSKIGSASTGLTYGTTPQESFSKAESKVFKAPAHSFTRKKSKKKAFTVHKDSSPPFSIDGSSDTMSSAYTAPDAERHDLVSNYLTWPRQQFERFDPFQPSRDFLSPARLRLRDGGCGKENDPVSFVDDTFEMSMQMPTNPLFCNAADTKFMTVKPRTIENRLNPAMALRSDPFIDQDSFMPVRNPLMLAMEQLTKVESVEPRYIASFPHSQSVFAP